MRFIPNHNKTGHHEEICLQFFMQANDGDLRARIPAFRDWARLG